MEKVNWGMWVAFCLRLALQKLDGELGIVLELALCLFLRAENWGLCCWIAAGPRAHGVGQR